jgi:type III secretory pathway component EscT
MSAIFIAGFGLWLLAKVSKALVSLFVFFPVKALLVLFVLIVMITSF